MFCNEHCLYKSEGLVQMRDLSDALNNDVLERVNRSQQLVMLSNFSCECNEYRFQKSCTDRISDVSSWRWVLEDLSKRIDNAIEALRYEHSALRTVVNRINDEINSHSGEASRPGALSPLTDCVEDAILQEFKFLREQKNNFEKLITELDKHIIRLEKTRNRINVDILNKNQAITIDEVCATKNYHDVIVEDRKKKRKKGSPLIRWVRRSEALKRAGLKALCNAVVTRQQVREARMQLSVSAQAYSSKVDATLRRRLHSNTVKLHDLNWQRQEAVRDYQSLDEELISSEKSLVDTIEKGHIVERRIVERSYRPFRELTKDDVNDKLIDELRSLKKYIKELRINITRVISLQNNLSEAVAFLDNYAEDLLQVISLDEDRIRARLGSGDQTEQTISTSTGTDEVQNQQGIPRRQLSVIQEENEFDNYPEAY